ncbi:MAG: hypothetical protein R2844_15885 [Caldilineales bacterium]
MLDLNGQPIATDDLVRYWSDGLEKLADPLYQGYIRKTPKSHSGWANLDIYQNYYPDQGKQGPWCWAPAGAADVVVGGGLPYKLHVSTFAVWRAERRETQVDPPPRHRHLRHRRHHRRHRHLRHRRHHRRHLRRRHRRHSTAAATTAATTAAATAATSTAAARRSTYTGDSGDDAAQRVGHPQHPVQPGCRLGRYAREHSLGVPLTEEFDVAGYRCQGFANGIVYVPIGRWDELGHTSW